MTQLNSSWRVFGRTKVLDRGYALKFEVDFNQELIARVISELPNNLSVACAMYLPRYLKKKNPIEIFIYKFGPSVCNPRGYILRRNLVPGNIIDLFLVASCMDLLKGRLVIACADNFTKTCMRSSHQSFPSLDFRGGKVKFDLIVPVAGRDRRSCYIATRI